MKPIAQDLALALLTGVKERGGTANKTKLLKLLYLADIEHFRKHGETLTAFDPTSSDRTADKSLSKSPNASSNPPTSKCSANLYRETPHSTNFPFGADQKILLKPRTGS